MNIKLFFLKRPVFESKKGPITTFPKNVQKGLANVCIPSGSPGNPLLSLNNMFYHYNSFYLLSVLSLLSLLNVYSRFGSRLEKQMKWIGLEWKVIGEGRTTTLIVKSDFEKKKDRNSDQEITNCFP